MNARFRIRSIDLLALLAIAGYCGWKGYHRPPAPRTSDDGFATQVRLEPLDAVAVQADGRLRSFESHAKTYMGYVSGPRKIGGQSKGFTYLDLIFRPERYRDADIIYVKNKNVRARILEVLSGHDDLPPDRAAAVLKSGLISPTLLNLPPVAALLQRLGQDLIRTSRAVDAITSAMTVSDGRFLERELRLVAPPNGTVDEPWISAAALTGESLAPRDDVHADLGSPRAIPGLDPDLRTRIVDAWTGLGVAWRSEDAAAVNAALAALAASVPAVSPELYPSRGRLEMESWYYRNQSMTWVWLMYLAAVMPLLMSIIYQWDRARSAGMVLFVLAFAVHTASVGVRWYVSGRWPNSNMFEAVTTSAWFGGVAAMVLEYVARRTAFRNLFALGSAVMSMAALMAAYFLPAHLDSSINNKMAALNDVWLYIHTNMIIWSYAVIGLACVPALLYLRNRWCEVWDAGTLSKKRLLLLPVAVAVLNYTGFLLLMHLIDNPSRGLSGGRLAAVCGAAWGSLMVLILELMAARERRRAGQSVERAAAGGASSLIMGPTPGGFLRQERPTLGQVLDGATMVLVELAFVMLWTGTVMGAIWADHSWGRPWGWDPKEVFALNTFIIFLILIHVRLKVRDKGFWTAVLAVLGFEVMLFNWIVVNFIITGLHSYA